ncbi:hypothetical protein TNIN_336901 [Trichonephila inaurata madagascariensis]|uniref:Uncharacterized protein n=1 Tax=Trichonephila inaurata madagascariensis TaxID=2747483 RepID=A0A8X6WLJ0_9ARAC|nr:hypothetical protein TNIN_336901 [Trichonephila inaurata madagascariensis]
MGAEYCTLGPRSRGPPKAPGITHFTEWPCLPASDKRVGDIFQIIFSLRCASESWSHESQGDHQRAVAVVPSPFRWMLFANGWRVWHRFGVEIHL